MAFCTRATALLVLIAVATPAMAQSQPGVGYGNSALGGFTPQPGRSQPPLGASVADVQNELERGFSDGAAQLNDAGQQASGAVRTTVDNLGRAIARPINNGRQLVGDIVAGPQGQAPAQPGQPLRNLADRAASGVQNTGEALRDSFDRAGQNTRETFGLSDPNLTDYNELLRQPPPGWNGQPAAVAAPTSWGTASDPLSTPPPGIRAASVPPGSGPAPNETRSVLVTPGGQPNGSRQPWAGSGEQGAMPASSQPPPPQLTSPPAQPQAPAAQPNTQQPTGQQPLYRSLVDRGPTLGHPAGGQQLTPVPGTNNPWGNTTSTLATNWNDQLRQPPPQASTPTGASPQLGVPDPSTANGELRTVSNESTTPNSDNQEAIRDWNRSRNESALPEGNANAPNHALATAGIGWTATFLIGFVMSLVVNGFQWINIVDLRNKYRNALRRGSPSLARTLGG